MFLPLPKMLSGLLLTCCLWNGVGVCDDAPSGTPQTPSSVQQEHGQIEIHSEAVAGEPFGVGKVVFRVIGPPLGYPLEFPMFLRERKHRVFYPVFPGRSQNPVGNQSAEVRAVTAYFLFQGNQTLHLQLTGPPGKLVAEVPVKSDLKNLNRLKQEWWSAYLNQFEQRGFLGERQGPGLLDNYLTSMLARRLQLKIPRSSPSQNPALALARVSTDWQQFLGIISGTESVRLAWQRDVLLNPHNTRQVADQPLPPAVAPAPAQLPEHFGTPTIEPLAKMVPEECFYVRCQQIQDWGWFRSLLASGGSLAAGVLDGRVINSDLQQRIERQLALRELTARKTLTPSVVSDMAVIGTDPFFRHGSAVGFLFEATDEQALHAWLRRERQHVRFQVPTAKIGMVKAGADHFLSFTTEDNRVRSFTARRGKYTLITNSTYLVKRFLEASQGERSLGDLKEFLYARSKFPLERNDLVFVYLSDPFFRRVLDPQYRVEMTRRMQSAAELELVQLAQMTAQNEGLSEHTLESYKQAGLLPDGFGHRSDGSHPILHNGICSDSLRGALGTFLPIPDVTINKISRSELSAYRRFSQMYRNQWRQMDPVCLAAYRKPGSQADRMRVVVEFVITPFAQRHYLGLQSVLTIPTSNKLAHRDGELLTGEVAFQPNFRSNLRANEDEQVSSLLFGGLQDFPLSFSDLGNSNLQKKAMESHFFLGFHSDELMQSMFPNKEKLDQDGYSKGAYSLHWRFWNRGWGAFSPSLEVLKKVTPQLKFVPASHLAQVRVRIGSLKEAKVRRSLEQLTYLFARSGSYHQAQTFHILMQQFGVSDVDAPQMAARLFRGQLICPLGGQYQMIDLGYGQHRYASNFWSQPTLSQEMQVFESRKDVPTAFRLPILDQLHSVEIGLSLLGDTLTSYCEVELPRPDVPEDLRLRTQHWMLLKDIPDPDSEAAQDIKESGGRILIRPVISEDLNREEAQRLLQLFPEGYFAMVTLNKDWKGGDKGIGVLLPRLKGLSMVSFEGLPLTRLRGSSLQNIPNLKGLVLSKQHLDLNAFAELAELKQLKLLALHHVELSDKHVSLIAKCSHLQNLVLHNTEVSSEALKLLSGIKTLRMLTIRGIPLTSAQMLALTNCKQLTFLDVNCDHLTPEERKQLQAALPNCRIKF